MAKIEYDEAENLYQLVDEERKVIYFIQLNLDTKNKLFLIDIQNG